MLLRADTSVVFGAPQGTPVLDDVKARLLAVRGQQSRGFFFSPHVRVRPWAHLQGIARLPLLGREPWFVISKHHHDDAQQAGFLFVHFPRGPSSGEALARDLRPQGPGIGKLTSFWGRGRSEHPGGLQSSGSLVATAQDPSASSSFAFVSFIDGSDPRNPFFLPALTLDGKHGETAMTGLSCAALTRLDDGRALLLAYRYSENHPGICRALLFRTTMPFLNANSAWERVSELTLIAGLPAGWVEPIENIAFLGQADGKLFVAALRGRGTDNRVDLYELAPDGSALEPSLRKTIRTLPGRGTFRAGGGLYVTPTGELVIYAVQQAGGSAIRNMMIEEFSP